MDEPPSSLASLQQPIAATWSVRAGRDAYLAENAFTVAGYDAARSDASLFGFRFSVPNPPPHRWAIMRHDLHHVATGYGTDLVGEVEIAAWEFGCGLRQLDLQTWLIVFNFALLGIVVAPLRAWHAYRAAKTSRSLFVADGPAYEEWLDRPVAALREHLGLPSAA